MNHKARIKRLEGQTARPVIDINRLTWVLNNPGQAATAIGETAVTRILELMEIVRARKGASHDKP